MHWFERLTTGILAFAAIFIAAILARREFIRPTPAVGPSTPPQYVEDWRRVLGASFVDGDSSASVVIVEFMDFECPFCKNMNSETRALREKYGDKVALAFVHFPLEAIHRFARPAATATECAGKQGRFMQMADAIFNKQDSLGLKNWNSYAQSAGVPDTTILGRCISNGEQFPRIDAGLEAARRLGVTGTPTLMLNGWLLRSPPSAKELDSAVEAFLDRRTPYVSEAR